MRRFSTLLRSLNVHQRLSLVRLSNSSKKFVVSPDDIKTYKRDGVVCLRGVLTSAQCTEMYEATEEFMTENKGRIRYAKDDKRFFSAAFMSDTVPEFKKFAKHSQLSSIAAHLMNNIKLVRFFYDHLFIKAPGTRA